MANSESEKPSESSNVRSDVLMLGCSKVEFKHPLDESIEMKMIDNPSGSKFRQENSSSERLIAKAIREEYRYARFGLILGMASIIGGIILGLNGVAGSTSWTAKLLALESNINDAAPGVVLFLVGLFMVWATKPKVKLKDLKG